MCGYTLELTSSSFELCFVTFKVMDGWFALWGDCLFTSGLPQAQAQPVFLPPPLFITTIFCLLSSAAARRPFGPRPTRNGKISPATIVIRMSTRTEMRLHIIDTIDMKPARCIQQSQVLFRNNLSRKIPPEIGWRYIASGQFHSMGINEAGFQLVLVDSPTNHPTMVRKAVI